MAEFSGEMGVQRRDLQGSADYERAVNELLVGARRTLRIFDRALSREYNSPQRHQGMRSFLLGNRANRVQIVVHDASNLARDCPRLINLLRQFSHALMINQTQPHARRVYDAFVLVDERHYARRFHVDQPRGVLALSDQGGADDLLQRFGELWEASAPGATGTTLGL